MTPRSALFGAVAVVGAWPMAHAQRMQSVAGRVLGDSARPVGGAMVSVTMAPDRMFRQDTSDADGRWSVAFPNGTGDYLVHIAALGRQSFRKRVTMSPADTVMVVDATLPSSVQRLDAVRVQAAREKPSRETQMFLPDGVSAEYFPMGVEGALAPDMRGNLAALAVNVPGLAITPNGVVAFGLDPAQNAVTLNGLSFPGATLPRGAATSTSFTTSTYDPSRGGFAGVETTVMLTPGDYNTRRQAWVTLDAPPLQATDRISRQLGQRVTAGQASMGGSGTLVEDVWNYSVAADVSRRVVGAPSLTSADASLFPLAGVAPDSVARLLRALPILGIPLGSAGTPSDRISDDASFALRLDHSINKPQSFDPSNITWGLVALGRLQRAGAQGVSITTLPTRGARNDRTLGVIQFIRSSYVKEFSLSETRTGLSFSRSSGTPYLGLPEGNVLVSSTLANGATEASALGFGGSARSGSTESLWSWETRSDYEWITRVSHRLKLTAQGKLDGYQTTAGDVFGRFSYSSLAALAANRPSSFTRTLQEPDREGGQWTGFAALGDHWRKSRTLQFVYGARVDANRYLFRPAANTGVASALGARTDVAPSRVDVSPRLGFSWRYLNPGSGFSGVRYSGMGTRLTPPSGMLRGGIGKFRAAMPLHLLSSARVHNGLPDGAQRVSCVGDAVPIPDWTAYANDPTLIPSSCSDVASAPLLSDIAPDVHLVDPSFDAPKSWRANLGLMTIVKGIALSLDGSVGLNLAQPSVVDLNFSGTQRFVLADEERAVFVSPSAIVPGTGLVSPVEARRTGVYGTVLSRRSDLRSASRQLVVALSPKNMASYFLNVAYTLSSTTGDTRGYDGSAFGDPRTVERARGSYDVRHRVSLQVGKSLPRGFSVTAAIIGSSGMPYTPLVNGDVNGDGISGDRAFIANPDAATDAALAAGVRGLLANAPSSARACLVAQLGKAAGANSCEGPWSAVATARIGLANPFGERGRAVSASLGISNPLAGADMLLHGETSMRGWGVVVRPDPVLLTVRGFDPVRNRFRYDVNSRFGSTAPQQTTLRAPFRVTLDVTIDLSPPFMRQQVERVLNRGRAGRVGERLSADSIRTRFSRNIRSPIAAVIDEADSLLLSREQLERLREREARLRPAIDSVWRALGTELAALGHDYDPAHATRRTEEATDAAWELARKEIAIIKEILSPLQYALAPWIVPYLANVKPGAKIRIFSMY